MSDNPFDEPGDSDRTIIRPAPRNARAAGAAAPRVAVAPVAAAVGVPVAQPEVPGAPETVETGDGPLAVAAAPLLQLLARLRTTATAPDAAAMREKTRRELRAFERRAVAAGVPVEQMRMAHYALCATLDDVVLNTPWGAQGGWRAAPLSVELHQDEAAGSGFFDQLRTLRSGLPAGLPVMRLMFLCLSLGMMGVYRGSAEGGATLERVRHQVFGLLEAEEAGAALSERVAGVQVPVAGRGRVPVWVAGSAALGVVAAVYVGCLTMLNRESDGFYQMALAAPPAGMPALVRPAATPAPPPPPPPALPDAAARLREALAGVAGVEVLGTPALATVRIAGDVLFPKGGAGLAAGVMDKVAQAVGGVAGRSRCWRTRTRTLGALSKRRA